MNRKLIASVCGMLLLGVSAGVNATFVGDLVYCDVNANGVFDEGDYGLNNIGVSMTCVDAAGMTCFAGMTTTGPAVLGTQYLDQLGTYCDQAPLTWNPDGDITGRYLFEISGSCPVRVRPVNCTITVMPETLPADCNVLVTPDPANGFPADGNMDGDYCDPEDGPFPEGQVLGNTPLNGGCEAWPDPAPGEGVYTVNLRMIGGDSCSIYNDFGFRMFMVPGTGTPGYWKNHPEAWPVDEIVIGGMLYSKDEAIGYMMRPVRQDKTFTMFPALVATKLNVLIGNDASCIADTIAAADAWLAEYPVGSGVPASSDAWQMGEPLYYMLDQYNNGYLCAPSRDALEDDYGMERQDAVLR